MTKALEFDTFFLAHQEFFLSPENVGAPSFQSPGYATTAESTGYKSELIKSTQVYQDCSIGLLFVWSGNS